MNEDHRLTKVEILLQQKKYSEAERVLKELLFEDSNNIHFLSLLAEVNLQQDKFEEAKNIIDNAIGRSPDSPFLFYTKSRIALQQDDYNEAEKCIKQSIALDPYDADYFALLANIKLSRKKYDEALKYADRALEIDPENLLGLNTRSTALLKLDKKDESFETIEGALRSDPNNSYTHANYGWGLLEKGDYKKAKEHFKEALQSNPNNEYAKSGMATALKATNPFYRLFLKYAFWMSNLTAKYQWGVIIGFYIGFRTLRSLADSNENLQPYLIPIIVALAIFAFSTWVMDPISNLFLRFNKYGQYLLDKNEKMSSNFVAVSFFTFLAGLLLYFVLNDMRFLSITVFGFAMMLPFGVMFSNSKKNNLLLIYAIAMSAVGLLAIGTTFIEGELMNMFSVLFVLGFVLFQWVANFIMIKKDNK